MVPVLIRIVLWRVSTRYVAIFFFDWHFSGEPSLRYMVLFLFSRWNDFLIESTGILLFFFGLFGFCVLCSVSV